MKTPDCNDDDRDALMNNRCPDCGNYGFHDGPRGGLSQNVFCCSPYCRSGFNLGPTINGRLIMAQRIGRGRLGYYPPQTHATTEKDRPVCAFTILPAIGWPHGHQPGTERNPEITCPDCLATLKDWSQKAMAAGRFNALIRKLKGEQ